MLSLLALVFAALIFTSMVVALYVIVVLPIAFVLGVIKGVKKVLKKDD